MGEEYEGDHLHRPLSSHLSEAHVETFEMEAKDCNGSSPQKMVHAARLPVYLPKECHIRDHLRTRFLKSVDNLFMPPSQPYPTSFDL